MRIFIFHFYSKIIFEGKKAVGVELIYNGRKERVMVNKEIILSGGSIGSPQILMLSGVGPKKHLEEFGVSVYVFINHTSTSFRGFC